MRWLLLSLALVVAIASSQEPPKPKASNTKKSANADQRGTAKSPLVVELTPSEDAKKEAADNAAERKEKRESDRNLVILTGVLGLIGTLQLVVFGLQAEMLRRTVKAADKQADDMQRSIAESARSASAIENVAEATKNNAVLVQSMMQKQMRAYLTVVVGGAIYQVRESNVRFEARPKLINTGLTPAYNVRYCARAAILPSILPAEFEFPLPDQTIGGAVLGSRHDFDLSAVVEDFVPDEQVQDVKHTIGRALHVWGMVTYRDVFGNDWETKFAQTLHWIGEPGKEIVFGYYNARHNDAS